MLDDLFYLYYTSSLHLGIAAGPYSHVFGTKAKKKNP